MAENTAENGNKDATVLLSLEEMIKNKIVKMDKLKAELREKKHMYADSFENDPTYKEHAEKAKEATIIKSQTKLQIAKQPAVMQMAEKIKAMSAELKEEKEALSDYLIEYQRITNATQLELFDGTMVDIVNSAKVVKPWKR